jgi:predicted kinase
MDRGLEVVEDPEERARLRRQARRVHLRTLLVAAVLTGGVMLFPE